MDEAILRKLSNLTHNNIPPFNEDNNEDQNLLVEDDLEN